MYSVCLAPPPYRGGTHNRRAASFYVSPSIPPSPSLLPPSLGHHCSRSLEELKSIFCRSNRPRPPAHSLAPPRHGEAGSGERRESGIMCLLGMADDRGDRTNGGRRKASVVHALRSHYFLDGWMERGKEEGIRGDQRQQHLRASPRLLGLR